MSARESDRLAVATGERAPCTVSDSREPAPGFPGPLHGSESDGDRRWGQIPFLCYSRSQTMEDPGVNPGVRSHFCVIAGRVTWRQAYNTEMGSDPEGRSQKWDLTLDQVLTPHRVMRVFRISSGRGSRR